MSLVWKRDLFLTSLLWGAQVLRQYHKNTADVISRWHILYLNERISKQLSHKSRGFWHQFLVFVFIHVCLFSTIVFWVRPTWTPLPNDQTAPQCSSSHTNKPPSTPRGLKFISPSLLTDGWMVSRPMPICLNQQLDHNIMLHGSIMCDVLYTGKLTLIPAS